MAATARGLCEFIDASPSPFHVCATVASRLRAAGYTELAEADEWPSAGKFFTVRAGSLVAWDSGTDAGGRPFRVIGGHTDSPNLRVKQHPDRAVVGWQMVALEPYGGAWLNSWLDRDLGVSGRLSIRDGGGVAHRLVRIDAPILRVPQLAIHLAEDRKSLTLDPQRHVNAVWGADGPTRPFVGYVAQQAGIDPDDVLGADLMTHDLTPSTLSGLGDQFVSAPRLDNQASCYAGLEALLDAAAGDYLPVLALFDHEEVGSTSDHGADSELLPTTLERIVLAGGGGREDFLRRLPGSIGGLGGHGARHPSQLPGAARARPPHRGQRWPGAQGAPESAVRDRWPHRRCVRAGLPAGRGAAAALRTPRRLALWLDDRSDDVGPHRHPDGRCRRPSAGHALSTGVHGRQRRRRLRGGAAGILVARLTPGRYLTTTGS